MQQTLPIVAAEAAHWWGNVYRARQLKRAIGAIDESDVAPRGALQRQDALDQGLAPLATIFRPAPGADKQLYYLASAGVPLETVISLASLAVKSFASRNRPASNLVTPGVKSSTVKRNSGQAESTCNVHLIRLNL